MLNFKKIFMGVAVAASCTAGGRAIAFDLALAPPTQPSLGTCTVTLYHDGTYESAFVQLRVGAAHVYAGGNYLQLGIIWLGDEVAESDIASCFGAASEEIKNLDQDGVDGNYSSENYVGFSFDYDGFHYEFGFSGATNTQIINTKTSLGPSSTETSTNLSAGWANLASGSQPGFRHFLTGSGQNELSAVATSTKGQFKFTSGMQGNTWADVSGAWSTTGTNSSGYAQGVFGAHTHVGPEAIWGLMLQADQISALMDSGTTSSSSTGVLIGPYFASRATNDPVFFEGSLLYGGARNQINTGSTTGSFNSTRLLGTLKVSGAFSQGDWTLSPHLDGTYAQENQAAYTDSGSTPVAAKTVTQGNISLGLGFSRPLESASGQLTFRGDISGIATVASDNATLNGSQSGRVELGLEHMSDSGMRFSLKGWTSGLGLAGHVERGVSALWQTTF